MLVVAGKQYLKPEDFSKKFLTLLGWISGGIEWLNWALPITARPFHADSEMELLVQIQEGLHASGLMPIQELDLLVNAGTMMSLPEVDVEALASYIKKPQSGKAEMREILRKNSLKTGAELIKGVGFLGNVGVAENHVMFLVLPLQAQVSITELSNSAPTDGHLDHALQKQAAAFAVEHAETPIEFVEIYRSYMEIAAKEAARDQPVEDVESDAEKTWGELYELALPLLETPQLADVSLAEDPAPLIRSIAIPIGFATVSSAVYNIVAHSALDGESGAPAKKIIEEYVAKANEFVKGTLPYSNQVSQDGLRRILVYENAHERARLAVDLWGTLTISSYSTK